MQQDDTEFWDKAVSAREELVEQYAENPSVTLIDIGYPPEECGDGDEVVVRIHVTEEWFERNPDGYEAAQPAVDGIAVCVVLDEE